MWLFLYRLIAPNLITLSSQIDLLFYNLLSETDLRDREPCNLNLLNCSFNLAHQCLSWRHTSLRQNIWLFLYRLIAPNLITLSSQIDLLFYNLLSETDLRDREPCNLNLLNCSFNLAHQCLSWRLILLEMDLISFKLNMTWRVILEIHKNFINLFTTCSYDKLLLI